MKVYVIKEISTGRYQTPTYDFIKDLRQADLFLTYELAKKLCASDCEVVEVQIMETTDIADYTKQVRKEVVQELKNKMLYCSERIADGCHYYNGKELDEIIDQIQGEADE